jgi:mono/diheme cytochrome c family protein
MRAGLAIVAALMLAVPAISAPAPAGGAYTEAQAGEGAAIYAERCAMCHGKSQEGTWEVPPLRGKFLANWGRAPLSSLYDYLGHAMPQFAPGSLSPQDNVRLIAFLLKTNGQAAGAKPLSEEHSALAAIRVDGAGK